MRFGVGTFYLTNKPITQMYTINVFIRSDECLEQVPVLFVLMIKRATEDKAAFEKVKELLRVDMKVKKVTWTLTLPRGER